MNLTVVPRAAVSTGESGAFRFDDLRAGVVYTLRAGGAVLAPPNETDHGRRQAQRTRTDLMSQDGSFTPISSLIDTY